MQPLFVEDKALILNIWVPQGESRDSLSYANLAVEWKGKVLGEILLAEI
jgi:hypothetical protein